MGHLCAAYVLPAAVYAAFARIHGRSTIDGANTRSPTILDALLRIEEILRFAHPDNRATPYTGEDLSDVITQITPTKTPFLEAGAGGLIGGTSGLTEDHEKPAAKPRRRR